MQKIFRIYPPEWTVSNINELNKLLANGYKVVSFTTFKCGDSSFTDYIIDNEPK